MLKHYFFIGLNIFYALLLIAGGIFWLVTGDTFGWAMGVAALVCAVIVLCKNRWGYFAAAGWCFGLMRLGLDKYSGVYIEQYKHTAVGLCFLGIILAIILHETVAKNRRKKGLNKEPKGDSV